MAIFSLRKKYNLETKTETAGTSVKTVTPSAGYDGFSQIEINPTPSETKTVTAGTSASNVTPSSGNLLSKVTVNPTPSETKTVTPSESSQTVSPSSGKLLSGVTVNAIPSEYVKPTATKAATTYNTSTSDQTINSGTYLSGNQTIKAVTTSNIDAANIKAGVTVKVGDANNVERIKNVAGTFTSTVSSGQTMAGSEQILVGYSAFANGAEVRGAYSPSNIQSITPSNRRPVYLMPQLNYHPTAEGFAIESYTTAHPETGGDPSLYSVGTFCSLSDDGYIVKDIGNVTGNDSNPTFLGQTGSLRPEEEWEEYGFNYPYYNVTSENGGYLLASQPASVTPISTGAFFTSGVKKMVTSGYAYSSKMPQLITERLWTNANPTATFAAQTITLSNSISNYSYIAIVVRISTTDSTEKSFMIPSSDIEPTSSSSLAIGLRGGSGNNRCRGIYLNTSETQLYFSGAYQLMTSSQSIQNGYCIPVSVSGMGYHF